MHSFRRFSRRYRRFRQRSPIHYYGCFVVEFTAATALVYKFLAPLICR